ncbi:hypothetical protein SNN44_05075 [Corynebacterium pseudotuberculosis]|nr:hypothetical protein [Corynebacterium pseudotuberculosis]AZN19813.1 hypothetical protein CpCap1W_0975 [Corynebacterium pseudotuberculosis]MEA1024944.1 hypothetical protein [Corynebacterium pseudotuberculosis]MEB3090176.1 hypothetical protein [Corynebacterium pseudotuberculosis]MEB3092182.1 hypothetical protein [Corynebacterium pseudotuberculosis]MEB3105741.1 hypothetical protein [Corynebacterium pseudotuberculosis]
MAYSTMKLQKLLHFVASRYQKIAKQPLLGKVTSTWDYGEVVYSAWGEFCSFSKGNIKRYARDDARGGVFVIGEHSGY